MLTVAAQQAKQTAAVIQRMLNSERAHLRFVGIKSIMILRNYGLYPYITVRTE